jgi:hypothetical protein
MAEVEERRKVEEAKTGPTKANQSSDAMIDPMLLRRGSADVELAGDSGGSTNIPRMEDMMSVLNYLVVVKGTKKLRNKESHVFASNPRRQAGRKRRLAAFDWTSQN